MPRRDGLLFGVGGGQVDCPLWHIGSMTGVSVQDNADKRFHIKALPGRRKGAQGPPGWGRHGAAGAAQMPQAMAQGVERDKPEGGRWAVGRGWLEGRPSRRCCQRRGSFRG